MLVAESEEMFGTVIEMNQRVSAAIALRFACALINFDFCKQTSDSLFSRYLNGSRKWLRAPVYAFHDDAIRRTSRILKCLVPIERSKQEEEHAEASYGD